MSVHRSVPRAEIVLNSNGILSEKLISAVKFSLANNININVGVSLDGMGERHDRVRGIQGLFNKISFTLKELMKLKEIHNDKLTVTVGFIVSDSTISEMGAVKKYTKRLGAVFNSQWYSEAKAISGFQDRPVTMR